MRGSTRTSTNTNFGQGRGKSLAALNKQHDRLVEQGKPPKVKAVPMHLRQHHKPILEQREEEKSAAGHIGFNNMRGPGKQIGLSNLKDEGKWRCATCKQANDKELEACMRCKDPKKVLIEKKVLPGGGRSNSGPSFQQPPMRFTKCKKEAKPKPAVQYGKISKPSTGAAAAIHQSPAAKKGFVPQKTGQMMTFADL